MCDPKVLRRSSRKAASNGGDSTAGITAGEAESPAGAKVVGVGGGTAEGERKGDDVLDSEIDAGERFDGPEPVLPCTMRHHTHHALVWSAVAALFFYDGFFWSAPLMTMFMIWYADAYTAVLHCALDRPGCLNVKILKCSPYASGAARGFQAHHEFPLASTHGRGLYRMICDTQRIQLITIASAVVFARWNLTTTKLVLLKLVLSAYGGATGHFYAHGGGKGRGPVIRTLQKWHLMLPPSHHVGGHHRAPHDKNFGIVSGLSNYLLNPVLGHESPSLGSCLAAWAFLSLFDVAIIERCVAPASALFASFGAAVLGPLGVAVAA